MRSIKILAVAFAVAVSAQNVSAQSLLEKLIPILEDAVGSEKSPKAAPVAVTAPTKSVVKKVVNKVKGAKETQEPINPDVIIESSPPSTIVSDVPSEQPQDPIKPDDIIVESDVPSSIVSDVPSEQPKDLVEPDGIKVASEAPSHIVSNVPSDVVSDEPSFAP